MPDSRDHFEDRSFVDRYVSQGPPSFMPGHAGVLQMTGVLIREHAGAEARVLVVGAGGGLETRALAIQEPAFRFVGVDPAPQMIDLAREVIGEALLDRVELVEGTVEDLPDAPFDAATCLLVIGLLPDDGSKATLLRRIRARLTPGAPFVLADHCLDRGATDFDEKVERYGAYARASGVATEVVDQAMAALRNNAHLVPAERDEQLLDDAGFAHHECFYAGLTWRAWLARA